MNYCGFLLILIVKVYLFIRLEWLRLGDGFQYYFLHISYWLVVTDYSLFVFRLSVIVAYWLLLVIGS